MALLQQHVPGGKTGAGLGNVLHNSPKIAPVNQNSLKGHQTPQDATVCKLVYLFIVADLNEMEKKQSAIYFRSSVY